MSEGRDESSVQLEPHPVPVTLKGITVEPSCNESSGKILEGDREKGGTGGLLWSGVRV